MTRKLQSSNKSDDYMCRADMAYSYQISESSKVDAFMTAIIPSESVAIFHFNPSSTAVH